MSCSQFELPRFAKSSEMTWVPTFEKWSRFHVSHHLFGCYKVLLHTWANPCRFSLGTKFQVLNCSFPDIWRYLRFQKMFYVSSTNCLYHSANPRKDLTHIRDTRYCIYLVAGEHVLLILHERSCMLSCHSRNCLRSANHIRLASDVCCYVYSSQWIAGVHLLHGTLLKWTNCGCDFHQPHAVKLLCW